MPSFSAMVAYGLRFVSFCEVLDSARTDERSQLLAWSFWLLVMVTQVA